MKTNAERHITANMQLRGQTPPPKLLPAVATSGTLGTLYDIIC